MIRRIQVAMDQKYEKGGALKFIMSQRGLQDVVEQTYHHHHHFKKCLWQEFKQEQPYSRLNNFI